MSVPDPTPRQLAAPWTCPFCPLLCDGFGVDAGSRPWSLVGSDCPRATAALAQVGPDQAAASARVDGVASTLDDAVAAGARLLAASRQPLFGGLGTDVAGARALYALACRTGAIGDPAQGAALFHGVRALQDRGGFTTTLAEVRTRADLIVCIGGLPTERHPEFLRRCGGAPCVVIVTGDARPEVPEGVELVRGDGDLFDVATRLAARVAERAVGGPDDPLAAVATRLRAARYAVLVYETARLPAHGALFVEAIGRAVATLNRSTRAAALPLGGGDGASTVNAVFTWLSGLPLRTRAGPFGLEHDPVRFAAPALLADGAVDALLWIASFGTEPAPPATGLPTLVLGHPRLAEAAGGASTVFIPVATPGIDAGGHLLRTDGSVMLPLHAVRVSGLPGVADIVGRLAAALPRAHA